MLLLYWLYIFLVANAFFCLSGFFLQSVLHILLLQLLTQEYLMEDNVSGGKLCLARLPEDGKPEQSINQSVNSSNLLVST